MATEISPRSVSISRDALGVYTATSESGATLQFGRGDGLLSPVELLLAALAGCSSIDVDHMTSRRAEPTRFTATATADYVHADDGNVLDNLQVLFDIAFPEGEEGDKARARIAAAMQASHDKDCTVSRTLEAAVPVTFSQVD